MRTLWLCNCGTETDVVTDAGRFVEEQRTVCDHREPSGIWCGMSGCRISAESLTVHAVGTDDVVLKAAQTMRRAHALLSR